MPTDVKRCRTKRGTVLAAAVALAMIALSAGCSGGTSGREAASKDLGRKLDRAEAALPAGARQVNASETIQRSQSPGGQAVLRANRVYEVQIGQEEAFTSIQQALTARRIRFTTTDPWDTNGSKQVLVGGESLYYLVTADTVGLVAWQEF